MAYCPTARVSLLLLLFLVEIPAHNRKLIKRAVVLGQTVADSGLEQTVGGGGGTPAGFSSFCVYLLPTMRGGHPLPLIRY